MKTKAPPNQPQAVPAALWFRMRKGQWHFVPNPVARKNSWQAQLSFVTATYPEWHYRLGGPKTMLRPARRQASSPLGRSSLRPALTIKQVLEV